ncbi:hypothetical protein DICTH_0268 [Dictyoglomus thermophilum H-6-12]|uniref:Uncharacterized protein n=1 Tax=Dictyoglomus thermophilum (strain ATCC 35947 / DSM 3960 / H-6-12) TaxID=309799 RepID=B5YC43_DICT6|nr:hypothetical protein DICTH_0268 [Dictyoglomus thermophilum H-6-12]
MIFLDIKEILYTIIINKLNKIFKSKIGGTKNEKDYFF